MSGHQQRCQNRGSQGEQEAQGTQEEGYSESGGGKKGTQGPQCIEMESKKGRGGKAKGGRKCKEMQATAEQQDSHCP